MRKQLEKMKELSQHTTDVIEHYKEMSKKSRCGCCLQDVNECNRQVFCDDKGCFNCIDCLVQVLVDNKDTKDYTMMCFGCDSKLSPQSILRNHKLTESECEVLVIVCKYLKSTSIALTVIVL